jgi:DNA-binding transcriptional regulator GbsR (MarR family)
MFQDLVQQVLRANAAAKKRAAHQAKFNTKADQVYASLSPSQPKSISELMSLTGFSYAVVFSSLAKLREAKKAEKRMCKNFSVWYRL